MRKNDAGYVSPGANRWAEGGGDAERGGQGGRRDSRLWLWIVALFLAQIAVWVVWFSIARKHPVQEVPLVVVDEPRAR